MRVTVGGRCTLEGTLERKGALLGHTSWILEPVEGTPNSVPATSEPLRARLNTATQRVPSLLFGAENFVSTNIKVIVTYLADCLLGVACVQVCLRRLCFASRRIPL